MNTKRILVIVLELVAVSAVAIGLLTLATPSQSLNTETYSIIQR